ncbi:hypothetical protein CHH28_14675 [Bacterioplanes sanyensis]|uniref:Uncharacterized protein n=2 Tax=Bacterioplanes sanyensis TaxID=1249553 RepID=A0A222FN89_9GAMM|nr:hypothetical protein CHH28_14675 [Bacterioplanes sanyensis]
MSLCGGSSGDNFIDATISESREVFLGTPGRGASVFIVGDNTVSCINGDLETLIVAGQGSRVVVNGEITSIEVKGESFHQIYAYGGVVAAELRGGNTEIYAPSIATYDSFGPNNVIKNLDEITL